MEKVLKGIPVAKAIYNDLNKQIGILYNKGVIPKLAVFKIGNDPSSAYYVANIQKRAKQVGIHVEIMQYETDSSEKEIINDIQKANNNPNIHGIMIQLPLPERFNQNNLILQIAPNKDIDGLHPMNAGKLILDQECFIPCTPSAIMELLHYYEITIEGAQIVIIGRSSIVGIPLLHLLVQKKSNANATVTLCHSKTRNIKDISRKAEIVIVAIGKPEFIDHTYLSRTSIVIDVGINEFFDAKSNKNSIVGDVFYEDVFSKVRAITPVPGGIGSITTASLLKNVTQASRNQSMI